MKNFKNNFVISGYVGYADVQTFANSCVVRFSINVRRTDNYNNTTSAFLNAEAWIKNEDADEAFKTLEKGNLITIQGYFKPEEWTDKDGKKQNKVVFAATKFYPTEEKEISKK